MLIYLIFITNSECSIITSLIVNVKAKIKLIVYVVMSLRIIFGENIKFYRKQKGLSQQQFSEQCKIVPNYVSEIENGKKFPSPELIEKFATVLAVEPYVLFMDSKDLSDVNLTSIIQKQNNDFSEALQKSIHDLLLLYGFISN